MADQQNTSSKGQKRRTTKENIKKLQSVERFRRDAYGLKCRVALGGTVPHAPHLATEVFSVQERKDELNAHVDDFKTKLDALQQRLDQLGGGESVDIDMTPLRVPWLDDEVLQQQVPWDVSALQASGAAAGQAAGRGDSTAQQATRTAGAPAGESEASGSSAATWQPQTLQQLKRKREQELKEAAKYLSSVAEVVKLGKRMYLPFRYALSAMASDGVPAADAQRGNETTALTAQRLPPEEVLLHVVVHNPDVPVKVLGHYLVASSTKLSALKDAVHCVTDQNMANLQSTVPSSYLYFEGVFYIDKRGQDWMDYSEPIREFCRQKGIQPPGGMQHRAGSKVQVMDDSGFGVADMDDVTFGELCVQLQGPRSKYLYLHQGCCEHCITVRGLRQLHPDDHDDSSAYPVLFRRPPVRVRNCLICQLRPSSWVTYDDVSVSESPCFWCQECYAMMHLDEGGAVRDKNLKVFPYVHE